MLGQERVSGDISRPTGSADAPPEKERLLLSSAVKARKSGLWLPVELTIDAWFEIGTQIAAIGDSSAWWLGDWLIYGKRRFPDRYKEAIENIPPDYQTLRNYAWVCRQFPATRRRATLSFQHHAEVASLYPDEQEEWLDKAEALSWSMHEFRRQLRAGGAGNRRQSDGSVKLMLEITSEQRERWRAAATANGVGIQNWIAVTLDSAVDVTSERIADSLDQSGCPVDGTRRKRGQDVDIGFLAR